MEEQVVDEKKRKRIENQTRYRQKNREKLKEKNKQYRLENREKLNEKKKQYRLENKEEISEKNRQYRLENKEKTKESRRRWLEANKSVYKSIKRQNHLKRKYNISLDDYNRMLIEQDGKCWTCSVKAEDEKLVVDHNHLTGEVRGLLCNSCNTAIGLLKESQVILEKVSRYLQEKGSCVLKGTG